MLTKAGYLRRMNCLVLHELPLVRERLLRALGLNWAEIQSASTSADFATALEQPDLAVILTDWKLSWADGPAVVSQARDCRPEVPVIVVADLPDAQTAAAAFRAGASDVVGWAELEHLPKAVQAARSRSAALMGLRVSEAHQRLVAELAADYAYALDLRPDGRFVVTWLSRSLEHQDRHPLGAVRGLDQLLADIYPEDLERVQDYARRLLAGQQETLEVRVRLPDGSARWLQNAGHPVRGPTGAVVRVFGAARDITLRKQTEAAERDQRLLAEALRDTAAALNSTLHFNYLLERILLNVGRVVPHEAADVMLFDGAGDQAVARLVRWQGFDRFGLSDEWLRALRLPAAQYPNVRAVIRRRLPVLVSDTQTDPNWIPFPELSWIRSSVSAPIMVRDTVIGIVNALSSQAGFFTSTQADRLLAFADQAGVAIFNAQLYDSVQQQAAELAALYRASAPLVGAPSDAAELAQRITDTLAAEFSFAHVAIGLLDEVAGELVFIALTGHPNVKVLWHLPLDGPGLTVAAARTGETVYVRDVTADPRYIRVNPSTRSEFVVPLKIGGRILGVLDLQGADADAFSERDRRLIMAFAERVAPALQNALLVRDLTLARQAAEAANRAKSEFLANTSHELRTPLTGILGSLDLVLDGLCDSREEERKFLEVASQASRNLLGLINNLLDIAKVEAGQLELLLQEVDAGLLLAEAVALVSAQAAEKKVTLEIATPPPDLPALWADHTRARQIILHLLDNALKFTPPAGRIYLALKAAEPAATPRRMVHLTVTDTGVGIALEQQSKLFRPFTQADGSSTRRFGGSGLGLSIARRLAELMNGSLALYSAGENQGATVTLSLPAAAPPGQ